MLARLETRYSSRRTFETYTYNGNYPLASAQVGRFKKRAIGEAMDDLRYFDVAILTVFVSKRGLRQNAANRDSFICNVKTIFQVWRLIQAKHSSLESVDAPEGGSVWEAAGQAVWLHGGLPVHRRRNVGNCALVCVDGVSLRPRAL